MQVGVKVFLSLNASALLTYPNLPGNLLSSSRSYLLLLIFLFIYTEFSLATRSRRWLSLLAVHGMSIRLVEVLDNPTQPVVTHHAAAKEAILFETVLLYGQSYSRNTITRSPTGLTGDIRLGHAALLE